MASRLLRRPKALVSLLIIGLHAIFFVGAPLVARYDPKQMHWGQNFQPPSARFWFGTDQFGRDVYSRVVAGSRTTLIFAVGATLLSVALALPLGLASGYYGGRVDQLIMRSMDVVMSFPSLLLGLLILLVAGSNITNLILAIGVVYCPRTARVIRSAVLGVRHQDFVEAARVRGESAPSIMTREVLPNAWGPIIVEVCIRFGYAVLLGASFNYLGLGVQPPAADWGLMISEARKFIQLAPWIAFFPAAFVSSLVVAFNLLGDVLTEALAGQLRGERAF